MQQKGLAGTFFSPIFVSVLSRRAICVADSGDIQCRIGIVWVSAILGFSSHLESLNLVS